MVKELPGLPNPDLFEKLPSVVHKGYTDLIVRQYFDGTLESGTLAAKVVFDDVGEVVRVECGDLVLGSGTLPFVLSDEKVWQRRGVGVYANQNVPVVDRIAKRLDLIVARTKSDWDEWKTTEQEHPGKSFRDWKAGKVQAYVDQLKALEKQAELDKGDESELAQMITPNTTEDEFVEMLAGFITSEDEEVLGKKEMAARKLAESLPALGVFAPAPATLDVESFKGVVTFGMSEEESLKIFEIAKRMGVLKDEPNVGKGRVSVSPTMALKLAQFLTED